MRNLFVTIRNIIANTKATQFAYDGCHKIYLIEDEEDKEQAMSVGYEERDFFPISELHNVFKRSCPLRFIYNWKLTNFYVEQGEEFEEDNL